MFILSELVRKDIRPSFESRRFTARRQCHLLTAIVAWFLTSAAHAEPVTLLPEPFSANYIGKKYVFVTAQAKTRLDREGDYFKYTMESEVKAPFYKNRLYDCSVMRVTDGDVTPIEHRHFESKQTEYNVRTFFDWQEKIASVKFDEKEKVILRRLDRLTWDPMSVQIQLMIDAMNGEINSGKTYTILEYAKKGSFHMAVLGEDEIDSVLGIINTLKIGSPSSAHEHRFWLYPVQGYIPVVMEISGVRINLHSTPDKVVSTTNGESTMANSGAIPGCLD